MSSGSRPVNKIAKKLRKASTILLKMCLYVLGYTGAGEWLATSGCSLAGCLRMSDGFQDRVDAGVQLARKLQAYVDDPTVMVLGLPRGGVPVAYEVAKALHAPMDVFVVRKLGAPGHRELAMGAIASGGVRVLNLDVIEVLGISPAALEAVAEKESLEMERQQRAYRNGAPLPEFSGRTIVLVDDGLATGSTMRAAIGALRQSNPARIIAAVPV